MAKGNYVTSDIYEAAALLTYNCTLKKILVDHSKDRPEAIFNFDGSVENLPQDYRQHKLLVDAKTFKRIMVELRRQMFGVLDGKETEDSSKN